MRVVVVGLGVQGRKRVAVAGRDLVTTVDPACSDADHRALKDVPLESYDAALVCVPDDEKIGLLEWLVANGKHALVEKPLLGDEATLRRLERAARERGCICYSAYNHRFEPHFVRMRDAIASGALGRIYLARLFYGNGTAREVRGSPWRDRGAGVLPDLGSHLLDTALFWFGVPVAPPRIVAAHRFENRAFDHVAFACEGPPALTCETTLLSWRNEFHADVYGERGSAHIDSLCKWGPSSFVLRTRVLPSGRPSEEVVTLVQPDPSWELEYAHFRTLCSDRKPSDLSKDVFIATALHSLSEAALAGAPA